MTEQVTGAAIDERESIARLQLARTDQVGPATFRRLMARYKNASSALEALPDLAARGGLRRAFRIADRARVLEEMEAGAALGAAVLHLGTSNYPTLLGDIETAPAVVWALGDPARLQPKAMAIVGGRNASALGMRFAAEIGAALAAEGLLVVSGLARGIDGAAHGGALAGRDGDGATAAVVAGGVDVIYPKENSGLYAEISERGVVLSEAPIGHAPMARDFPRRNRIISGLSLGVLVIEGRVRSGSLITAEAALDQGREAMAAPGHPLDQRATGCNRLIRDGAALIRSAEDVLEALGPSLALGYPHRNRPDDPPQGRLLDRAAPVGEPDDDLRARLLELIGPSPAPLDDLIRLSGAGPGPVAAALLELELAGKVVREPGGGAALGLPHDDP